MVFLDAHYSGGNTAKDSSNTPVLRELSIIKKHHSSPIILIDDIRFFQPQELARKQCETTPDDDGILGYPTIESLRNFILSINPHYEFLIYNDLAFAYPKDLFPNVHPAPVISCLTTSRLFQPQEATLKNYSDVLHAEKLIMEAQGSAKQSIKKLLEGGLNHPKYFTCEYHLWNDLICMQEEKYNEAHTLLSEIYALGFNDWRIAWYLALNSYRANDLMKASLYIKDIAQQIELYNLQQGKCILKAIQSLSYGTIL